ncbi:MAG TPA: hemolysin III family protein, partial [Solirubrobacteraceae bacterium]|nr:hemolysin III family protein [Solirubrobacteraceae bacterium]
DGARLGRRRDPHPASRHDRLGVGRGPDRSRRDHSAGAVIYARERPNPRPGTFGYHEVFHMLVLLACAMQYAVIAFVVLPLKAAGGA